MSTNDEAVALSAAADIDSVVGMYTSEPLTAKITSSRVNRNGEWFASRTLHAALQYAILNSKDRYYVYLSGKTLYRIAVALQGETWSLQKRFSDLHSFSVRLQKIAKDDEEPKLKGHKKSRSLSFGEDQGGGPLKKKKRRPSWSGADFKAFAENGSDLPKFPSKLNFQVKEQTCES